MADGVERGGRILVGGEPHQLGGRFFEPTVIRGVMTDAAISWQEAFAPVAGVIVVEDEAEVMAMANDTPYGLAGYLDACDVGRIWRVAEALEVGIVGVNTGLIYSEVVPFGGVKQSGVGRESAKCGIEERPEVKYLNLAGLDR